MPLYKIINTSTKGLWPQEENETIVRAESREEIIKSIINGKDNFIEKRLTPCHEYLESLIKGFRGEILEDLEVIPEEVENKNESQVVEMILKKIDNNSINDGGFYTAIIECRESSKIDKIHDLKT